MSGWLILCIPVLIAAFLVYRRYMRQRKRKTLLSNPLTPDQRRIVNQLVPITRRLPDDLRPALEGKINLFLDQIAFRGKGGIDVTDEMRLSIAAQACLLIVNSPVWYETLRNVLIYPTVIRTRRDTHDGNFVREHDLHMAGESWVRGPVVLSWDHALQGGLDANDGYNVVIHEFAHQLDSLTGHTNGIPVLREGQDYVGWEKAMLDAFHRHVQRVEAGHDTLIDPYGATNHEEFLAEAIVNFFEKPVALRGEEPLLYAQFAELLALDPAQWTAR